MRRASPRLRAELLEIEYRGETTAGVTGHVQCKASGTAAWTFATENGETSRVAVGPDGSTGRVGSFDKKLFTAALAFAAGDMLESSREPQQGRQCKCAQPSFFSAFSFRSHV